MFQRFRIPICLSLGVLLASYPQAAKAVEQLNLRLGFLSQTVAIADLENFAATGEIPPSLRLYSPFFTPEVKAALSQPWQFPPSLAQRFVDDLLPTHDGERVVASLHQVIPEANLIDLQIALKAGAEQESGLTLINLLRQYPGKKLTLELGGLATIAFQMNLPYLQSRLLAPWLAQEFRTDAPANSRGDLAIAAPDPGTKILNPSSPGDRRVRRRSWAFADQKRERIIPVNVYWGSGRSPAAEAPLVVISHGFAADRHFLDYLALHLASHGMIVVAIEHPKSNINWLASIALGQNPEALLPATEFVDRPLDVSFVLDRLKEISSHGNFWRGRFATDKVTIIGHSLGGYTALALAGGELEPAAVKEFCEQRSPWERSPADWFQCSVEQLPAEKFSLADPRIAQAIVLNPLTGKLFGDRGLGKINVPTLLLTSSQDTITPPLEHQLRAFQQINAPKYLLTAIGGTHLSVSDPHHINQNLATNPLVPEVVGEAAKPVQEVLKGVSLAFIMQLTPEANNYVSFLNPTYIQSRSVDKLDFRFNTSLPVATTKLLQMF
ncbi:MAG: alpha/beta hydrolase [Coleofasciculaceae cyanobacterium SM2_1_6]|nr:alpha/beta hydrolase [Coleofasciculaceae cyanobacterium SM2_1_6]